MYTASLKKKAVTSKVSYEDLTENFLQELINYYANNPRQFVHKENKLTKSFDVYLQTDRTILDWNTLKVLEYQWNKKQR